ncbi:MG406 family protein [Mesoplasma seiffertii]|uniref:MG406 family protein n=1 Tax=Mesoplasma seiffertii TaxID=28224 RepID=UPI0006869E4E|nr:MG406 family protein [Mesoplasma seiffertii]
MHKKVNDRKKWQEIIKILGFFAIISLISLIVIAILVGTKTISWNWLTGFILGEITAVIAIILVFFSVNLLIKTENHYLYYFMYLLRLGVYVAPFLLAFLIPATPFFYGGVLIGILPVVALSYLTGMLIKQKVVVAESESLSC